MIRCGNFPLLSAPHSLFSIWTDLKILKVPKRSRGHQCGGEDLANWAFQTLPKFTTGVKYQFQQGFWSDQRSGNPNHPSPPHISSSLWVICPRAGPSQQVQEPRLQFCWRQVFHCNLRNQGCSFTRDWIGAVAFRCFLHTLTKISWANSWYGDSTWSSFRIVKSVVKC